ncbi:MAG: hypothetical protein M3159_02715 [Actinomycetota bacterium]|nr:hypothetical protein [Actinomycetota bacterium]
MITDQRRECLACGFKPLASAPWTGDVPSGKACPRCGIRFGFHDCDRRDPLFYAGWGARWLVENKRRELKGAPNDGQPLHRSAERARRGRYECPACRFRLAFEPWTGVLPSDEICPCCGIQFGYDDVARRDPIFYAGWRAHWVANGKRWWSPDQPR